MPFARIQRALGSPPVVRPSEYSQDARFVYYRRYGLGFLLKREVVTGIMVQSPLFQTPEGIAVGAIRRTVQHAYGSPQTLGPHDVAYPERGLSFTYHAGRVARIYVVDREKRDLASGDRRIVPGVRVGGMHLGRSARIVLAQWGQPQKKSPVAGQRGATLWSYLHSKGMMVVVRRGVVAGLIVVSPEFRTPEGVHVGSSRADVVACYGAPQRGSDGMETYPRRGLGFVYDQSRAVQEIFVLEASR